MIQVVILAKNNDLPCNRELVTLLKEYMPDLIRAGLTFQFKIVSDSDERDLVRQKIDRLPVCFIKNIPSMGTADIKRALLNYLSVTRAREVNKSPDDELHDFYASEMNMEMQQKDLEEGDPATKTKEQIAKQVSEAAAARQLDQKKIESKKPGRKRVPETKRHDNIDDDVPVPRATAGARSTRVAAFGGDDSNQDDRLLTSMMEVSDL
jgi:hypothetical protein